VAVLAHLWCRCNLNCSRLTCNHAISMQAVNSHSCLESCYTPVSGSKWKQLCFHAGVCLCLHRQLRTHMLHSLAVLHQQCCRQYALTAAITSHETSNNCLPNWVKLSELKRQCSDGKIPCCAPRMALSASCTTSHWSLISSVHEFEVATKVS
jgi:hypothetical protein